jgi:hypothetical protein
MQAAVQVEGVHLDDFLFLVNDETGLTATVGLASPVADLPECGGSGPKILDGRGTHQDVLTSTGPVKIFDRWRQGTVVLYDVVAGSVCDLITAPVIGSGKGNFTFNLTGPALNVLNVRLDAILELANGGRAHLVSHAQIIFAEDGTPTIHVDKTQLKAIGG